MSLIRYGQPRRWFDAPEMYVYPSQAYNDANAPDVLVGVPSSTVAFAEVAMLALEQSGELDAETLAACQRAFATRFDIADAMHDGPAPGGRPMTDAHHRLAHTHTLEAVLDFAENHPDPYQTFDDLGDALAGSDFEVVRIGGEFVLLTAGGND